MYRLAYNKYALQAQIFVYIGIYLVYNFTYLLISIAIKKRNNEVIDSENVFLKHTSQVIARGARSTRSGDLGNLSKFLNLENKFYQSIRIISNNDNSVNTRLDNLLSSINFPSISEKCPIKKVKFFFTDFHET